jgi:tRNA-binding protein
MAQIKWQDFEKVDLRVGTIVNAAEFPEARRPAYKLEVDFGDDIGRRRASAQITDLYQPDDLIGKQVLGVVNFPPKQIGPFMSQWVILAVPDRPARNGDRLA